MLAGSYSGRCRSRELGSRKWTLSRRYARADCPLVAEEGFSRRAPADIDRLAGAQNVPLNKNVFGRARFQEALVGGADRIELSIGEWTWPGPPDDRHLVGCAAARRVESGIGHLIRIAVDIGAIAPHSDDLDTLRTIELIGRNRRVREGELVA